MPLEHYPYLDVFYETDFGERIMATFRKRLADFNTDRYPDEEIPVELLCKDKTARMSSPTLAAASMTSGGISKQMKP
jgi:hypothetical protein